MSTVGKADLAVIRALLVGSDIADRWQHQSAMCRWRLLSKAWGITPNSNARAGNALV
jgi:hypothetical protein